MRFSASTSASTQADRTLLDEPARQRIRALAADFPRIWNDDRTGAVERKRMLGLLIEDVTLLVDDQVHIHVRWRGGRTQSLAAARPRPMSAVRKTTAEIVALIDELPGDRRRTGRSPPGSTSSGIAIGAVSPSR